MTHVLAVVPARWASSRFPGKSLASIAGEPMIVHVWRRTCLATSVDQVIVATDDQRIASVCDDYGIEWVMTSDQHPTGSDRLAEVARLREADIYVNVQGDEPLIDPATIDAVVQRLQAAAPSGIGVATAYRRGATPEQCESRSTVHLVPGLDDCVITFSRLPVPYSPKGDYSHTVHVGLYAYARDALLRFADLPPGPVELAESIEPLRFLEHGERIACVEVASESIGVDEPADIARAEKLLAAQSVAAENE